MGVKSVEKILRIRDGGAGKIKNAGRVPEHRPRSSYVYIFRLGRRHGTRSLKTAAAAADARVSLAAGINGAGARLRAPPDLPPRSPKTGIGKRYCLTGVGEDTFRAERRCSLF